MIFSDSYVLLQMVFGIFSCGLLLVAPAPELMLLTNQLAIH